MVRKLLCKRIYLLFFFFLWAAGVFAQCPTTVSISVNTETTICEGTSVTFTANPTGGDQYNYLWQINGNGQNGETSSSFTTSTLVNGDKIKVIVSSSAEPTCTGVPSNTLPITVNPILEAHAEIQASSTSVCPGETVVYSIADISNHGGSQAQYEWLLNGNSFSPRQTGSSLSYEPSANEEITLKLISGLPCVDDFFSAGVTVTFKAGEPAIPGTIGGEASVCPGVSTTYSISPVTNATSYIWELPAGWSGTSSTSSITVTSGTTGGEIRVSAQNDCGPGPSQSLAVTVDPGKPAQPAAITGNAAVCPGTSETYSTPAVTNATKYTWTFPAGWNLAPVETSTPQIDITTGASGNGNISVIASNNCGDSPARTQGITMQPGIPDTPGAISGNTEVCPGVQEIYSVGAVARATEYVWTLPDGTEQITTTPTITVTTNSSGASNVSLIARNSCGSSASVSNAVTVKAGTPANAGDISLIYNDSGSTICPGGSLNFSVTAPTGADTFDWTVPTGWTITAGDETAQITVTAGQYGENGTVTVKPSNSCGTGTASSLAVSVDPDAPEMGSTSIDGPSEVCATGTGLVYSIPAINHANSYSWTVPTGWNITSAANGNSITVNPSATSGEITVTALNDCGASETIVLPIAVTAGVPDQPGAITSNIIENPNICPPFSPVTFSISPIDGADSYIWQIPNGWEFIDGEGTNSISVRINSTVEYAPTETIRVRAVNLCGPGEEIVSFPINMANHIITDIGEDKSVCKTRNPITINANILFGGAKFKPIINSSGSGTISTSPSNLNQVNGNIVITYIPSEADILLNSITLSLDVPEPNSDNSACKAGFDEMTIFFRENPTAIISGSSEICMGSSTELTVTGTPNTIVTYNAGAADKTIAIGATGTAVLDSGVLNQTTTFNLKSIQYSEAPSCPNSITGSATITVNPHPTAEFTAFATEYCNADPTSFTPGLTFTGTHIEGGFSSSSAALVVDPETGAFSPSGVPAGTYSITYAFDDTLGCGYQPLSTDITIYEKVTITTQPEGVRICEGQPLELSVAASGEGLTYEWYDQEGIITGATAATLNIPSASLTDEGTYYVIVSGTDPCEAVTSASAEVLVDSNISITSLSPDTSVCENGQVSLSVDAIADGEMLSYQWLKDGSPLTAQTNATLSLDPVQSSDAAIYTVIISGATGFNCNSLTSDPIELTVRETPSVEITGDAAICDGGSTVITFVNGLANGIVTYNINGGSSSTLQLDAAGNASLDTGSLTYTSGETTDYIFSLESLSYPDVPECITTLSGAVTVKVSPLPEAGFAFPGDQIAFCNSSAATSLTPSLTGTPGGVFSAPGLNIDTNTGAFSAAGVAAGNYTITYSIPPAGGCTEETATLDIHIYKEVKITSQPFNTGICSGETTQFEVSATGDDLTYQWYKGNIPGTAISGATSNILKISPAAIEDDGSYYVAVSGAGECGTVNSNIVTLNVDENIIISTQPVDQEVCLGTDVSFTIAATATGGDPVYQWQKDGVDLPGKTGTTLNLPAVSVADAGEYAVFIEGPEGYTCSTITSGAALLTVNNPPTVEAGDALTACYTTETINIGDGASASDYSSIEWSHDGAGVLSDPNVLETTYTPGTDESGTVTFTLTAFGNTCADVTDTKTLEIEPVPVITAFNYASIEFCRSDTEIKAPNLTGSHAYSGGTFAVVPETGLEIDASGNIDPANSEAGSYEIVYSTPAGAVCEPVQSSSVTVVIGQEPIADFAYDNTIFCKDTRDESQNVDPVISMLNGATPGTFSYTGAGTLSLNTTTGEIDLSASAPGVYLVTNTHDYTGEEEDGCALVSFNFEITITEKPIPDFTYSATEYCSDGTNPAALFTTPAVAGDFTEKSGNSGLVFANTATGEIDLASSIPGTYTIVNTIVAANGCIAVSAEQAISITKKPEASFAYSKEAYCFSEGMASMTYPEGYANEVTFSNEALDAFLDEATGIVTWTSANAAAIVGTHSIAYTIKGTGGCADVSGTLPLVIDAVPSGGELAFEGNGRIFMTCKGAVPGYAAPLTLTGFTGEILNWEYHDEFTTSWTTYDSQSPTLTTSEVETIVGDKSTIFRVIVKNGACEGGVYSATAIVSVIPTDIEPTPVTVAPNVLCYGNQVTLSSETGYGSSFGEFEGGAFDNAGIKNSDWDFTAPDGKINDFSTKASNGRADHWLRMVPHGNESNPNPKVYMVDIFDTSKSSFENFDPNLSNEGNEGFALVTGNNDSYMETPVFSLDGLDVAILTWDQAYNLTEGAKIRVEISTDGGATYQSSPLFERSGKARSGRYDRFGDGTPEDYPENKIEIDLGKYFGYTSLRVRFNYEGALDGDVWAVDDIKVPDGAQGAQLIWYYDDDIADPDNQLETIGQVNQNVVNFIPRKIGWNDFEVRTALLLDSNGDACETLEHAKTRKVFVFDQYTTDVAFEAGSCGNYSAQITASISGAFQGSLTANEVTLDGYRGKWSIEGPTDYTLKNPDGSVEPDPLYNPNAIIESESLGEFSVSWLLEQTISYPDDYYVEALQGKLIVNDTCPPVSNPESVVMVHCTTLDFDGVDDYVDLGNSYPGTYSIEAWIRPFSRPISEGVNTDPSTGTIISGPNFELSMSDLAGKVQPGTRWYHIAVTGGNLYIDGIASGQIGSGTGGERALIGARWNGETPEKYFSGWIEEVRIWNSALTEKQIRFMMNQRINEESFTTSTPIQGEIIKVRDNGSYKVNGSGLNLDKDEDVWHGKTWGDLAGYYRLISSNPDPLGIVQYLHLQPTNGNTPNLANPANPGRLHNMTTHQENTSPLPYLSGADGPWHSENTWLRPVVWEYPHGNGINGSTITWNIAQTSHNIHSDKKDVSLLGLISVENTLDMIGTISTPTGNELYISHYLRLDGVIDLNGESQLVQPDGSLAAGTGYLERDQQGTGSSFNYNYWSSPVSPAFGSTTFSVAGVMFDGTDLGSGAFDPIKFGEGPFYADTQRQKPIWISNYWIFGFSPDGSEVNANMYSKWKPISSGGLLNKGEGYTMKGTWNSAVAPNNLQNYTFKGFPNNGNIDMSEVHPNQNYLIGNPYPSAISVAEFINDNPDATGSGAVYYWDHFGGQSHYLKEYVGGYATINLLGSAPAASVDFRINNDGTKSHNPAPGPYIPVGQGFFINSTKPAGKVKFNNTQRVFKTEASTNDSRFHSQEKEVVKNSANDQIVNGMIRLNFDSPKGYWRQIAVGTHPASSNSIDFGYDALMLDNNNEDMFWVIEGSKFVIQGVPHFNTDQVLPLGIKIAEEGQFKIKVAQLLNIPDGTQIFLKDKLYNLYFNITEKEFSAKIEPGEYKDRYEIVFEEPQLVDESDLILPGEFEIVYVNGTREITLRNPKLYNVSKVDLNNILGQQIQEFHNIPTEHKVSLPVKRFSSGVYIVKVHLDGKIMTEKIIIE